MKSSAYWKQHFQQNTSAKKINWEISPILLPAEKKIILPSLQAWQLAETSDGQHLRKAASKYAEKINDPVYLEAIDLFIKEEQKHGENLGKYLDRIGEHRILKNAGDSFFRRLRHLNSSIEMWTLTVITVENTAQLFYQSLKDATGCPLLKQVCSDILQDEAYHIRFQFERLSKIIEHKSPASRYACYLAYKVFYVFTISLVWLAYRKVFKAGNNSFFRYYKKMDLKFEKTIKRLFRPKTSVFKSRLKWEQISL